LALLGVLSAVVGLGFACDHFFKGDVSQRNSL
jgi:hypothetical protein